MKCCNLKVLCHFLSNANVFLTVHNIQGEHVTFTDVVDVLICNKSAL